MGSNPTLNREPRKMVRENQVEGFTFSSGPCSRYITPPWFWDNLSKVALCRRALKEFDRRTKRLVALPPPKSLNVKSGQFAKLHRFARQGGPSLLDLRGYSRTSDHSSIRDRQHQGPDTMPESRAFDEAFGQHLADNGISLENRSFGGHRTLPSNYAEMKSRFAQRRRSLSPPTYPNADDVFEKFRERNESAKNAKFVIQDVLPFIIGSSASIPHSGGFAFKNLKALTDGSIQVAFPESYDGCRPGELDPSIREQLGEYIVPSTDTRVPCLPTFFNVTKGPKGLIHDGQRQVLYSATLGARAVHHLRCFITDSTPAPPAAFDNNAYVITALYQSAAGTLWLYATHPIPATSPSFSSLSQNSAAASSSPPPQNRPPLVEYRMTLIYQSLLTQSAESFREGVSAYRNAREWAKEKRDELVAAANAKVAREAKMEAEAEVEGERESEGRPFASRRDGWG